MTRPARQPSGNSGELSSQGILDNSPTPYGLHHDDPLMEGDVCWLVVKVDDPGNEYTFAAAHPVGHADKQFLIDRDCLQRLSHFRERRPTHRQAVVAQNATPTGTRETRT